MAKKKEAEIKTETEIITTDVSPIEAEPEKKEENKINVPSLISPAINLVKSLIELVKELIDDAKNLKVTSFFFIGVVAFFTIKNLKNNK
ncbi:MAG: hypothetical protein E7564_08160 [Ruminococcaceae bacterium]|nr:hypothetical protein [Oscillospiraceae bacterium]